MSCGSIWNIEHVTNSGNIQGDAGLVGLQDSAHYNISEHDVIGAGTHAQMVGYLYPSKLAMGRWYRSKEMVSGMYPIGGYLTNRHLNEVISTKY